MEYLEDLQQQNKQVSFLFLLLPLMFLPLMLLKFL